MESTFPRMSVSRRRLLGGTLAAAAAVGISDRGTLAGPGTATPQAATPASSERSVSTPHGTIALPSTLDRIVCVDWFSPEILLELGTTPIAVPDFSGNNLILPAYTDAVSDMPTITNTSLEVDLEAVAALKPDLILGLDWGAFHYEDLSRIAPTVLLKWNNTSGDWPTFAAGFAEILGRQDQLASLRSKYLARANELKSTYSATEAKTQWVMIEGDDSGQFYLYVQDYAGGVVLTDAGITLIPAAGGKTGTYVMVADEQVNELKDADVILIPADPTGRPSPATEQLVGSAPFGALKAAKSGNIFAVKRGFPASYETGIAFLDELETVLKGLSS
ncbi:MAG TPA: ABC transporter substrate-binding protein [Thermomicrobiales bacterium]|nr:ABC transporter substrate-binding protein [Thermomicrobiales bacterium]